MPIQMLSTALLSRRLRTTTALLTLLLVPASVMLGAGCSGADTRTGPPDDGWGGEAGDGSGGDGGKDGGGGTGKGDGGSGGGAGGIGGDAGESDGGDASPDDADIEYPPADMACEWDVAFRSSEITFVFPTARALGREIGAFLADPDEHRFVLAVRGSKGKDADGAISAADIKSGLYSFPGTTKKPTLTTFSLAQGRFDSAVQTSGFLVFQDEEKKEKVLHLTEIQVSSFTQSNCQQVLATVDATLPVPDNAGIQILSGGRWHTLADLAGMKDDKGNYTNVAIRFMLIGEATSFDFSSL